MGRGVDHKPRFDFVHVSDDILNEISITKNRMEKVHNYNPSKNVLYTLQNHRSAAKRFVRFTTSEREESDEFGDCGGNIDIVITPST